MSDPSIDVRKRNVNNKRLFREVDSFVQDGIDGLTNINNRSTEHVEFVIGMIEEWLETFVEKGDIIRYKVLVKSSKNKKNYVLYIAYTQTHCINTTSIEYTIMNLLPQTPHSNYSTFFLIP